MDRIEHGREERDFGNETKEPKGVADHNAIERWRGAQFTCEDANVESVQHGPYQVLFGGRRREGTSNERNDMACTTTTRFNTRPPLRTLRSEKHCSCVACGPRGMRSPWHAV